MTDPIFWSTAPAALGLLGLFFILVGVRQMRRRRPVASAAAVAGGVAFTALGLALGAVGATFLTYARLTYERPVAEVAVLSLNATDKRYAVTVYPADIRTPPTTCTLQGDEWLLSARVQTWKPWANLLGFDATYSLDQLANKYTDAAEANGKPITACALAPADPALARYIPSRLAALALSLLLAENRRFGSASYMPLADGATYRVVMTQQGLAAEPANAAARAAVNAAP